MFAIALVGHAIAPQLAALAPLAVLAMVSLILVPSRVTVGGDGVLVEWLRWKRFVPIGDIRVATVYDEGMGRNRRVGILLTLREGELLLLGCDTFWSFDERTLKLAKLEGLKVPVGRRK